MFALVQIAALVLVVELIAYKLYSSTIGSFYKNWLDGHKEWFDANQERVDAYVKRLGNFHQWFHDVCSGSACRDSEAQ